jgi:hypothetical protein
MSNALHYLHPTEEAAGLRPLTSRDCALGMIIPALVVAFAPVVLLEASSVPLRLLWVYLLLGNGACLLRNARRLRRLRRGERILVPTFEATFPTLAPRWLAAAALGLLTAINAGFVFAAVTILLAGGRPDMILTLFCLLAPMVALNVFGWGRLLRPRRRSAVAAAAAAQTGGMAYPVAAAEATNTTAPSGPRHWWTDTGTRNEVQGGPYLQQIRRGAADR